MRRTSIVLLLALTLVAAGCMSKNGGGSASTAPSVSEPAVSDAAAETTVDDSDIPFIDENDTVEIGEML